MKLAIYPRLKHQWKMYKLFIVCTIIFSVTFTCTKKADIIPLPVVATSLVVFKSADDVSIMLSRLYSLTKSGQLFGGRYYVYNDVRGEDFLNTTSNVATAYEVWRQKITAVSSEPSEMWAAAYNAINHINGFIEALNKSPSYVDAATATKYSAEARFLRALNYYALINTFAQQYIRDDAQNLGVVLRLSTQFYGTDDYMHMRRSTVGDVYEQIIADLNYAEENLPSLYPTSALNNTKPHKNSVIALKTRVYLTMRKWSDVVREANKIVSPTAPFKALTGVANTLQTSVVSVFIPPYKSTESMFSFPMGEENESDLPGKNNALASFYMPLIGNGDFALNPEGILANAAFTSTDARYINFVKRDFVGDQGRYRLTKFPTGPDHKDYIPVIRYAEVLLNLAEAKAKLAEDRIDASALILLNAVRGRSTTVYADNKFTTGKDLVNAILTERRIEFLGEGFRSIDLQRNLLPLPAKANVSLIETTASAYIWPIPSTEIALNKYMVQNP